MATFSVSAATVALDECDRVLLIRRADNGQWQIPGGIVERGEQPIDAALRETLEETGILVSGLKLTGVYTHIKQGIIAFVFLARVQSGAIMTSNESTQVEFVDKDDAIRRVPATFSKRVSDALDSRGIAFRAHDGINWVSNQKLTRANEASSKSESLG